MENTRTFRIGGVPEHFNLPWHLAQEQGIFEAHNVSVSYQDYPGGTGAMTRALASEDLDLAIVLTEGIIAAIHQGNPSRVLTSYVDSPLLWGIHVAANGPIQRPEEIQGKTFAISRYGSGSHLMAIVDAMQRNWPVDNLSFEKIGNLAGAVEALPAGKADVFLWERYSTQPHVDSGAFRRIGQIPTPWPPFMIAVREEIYAKYPGEIRSIMQAVIHSCKNLMRNPQAVPLIAQRYQLKEPQVASWFAQTLWSGDMTFPTLALLKTQKALYEASIIETELPLKKLCFVG